MQRCETKLNLEQYHKRLDAAMTWNSLFATSAAREGWLLVFNASIEKLEIQCVDEPGDWPTGALALENDAAAWVAFVQSWRATQAHAMVALEFLRLYSPLEMSLIENATGVSLARKGD